MDMIYVIIWIFEYVMKQITSQILQTVVNDDILKFTFSIAQYLIAVYLRYIDINGIFSGKKLH